MIYYINYEGFYGQKDMSRHLRDTSMPISETITNAFVPSFSFSFINKISIT